MVEDTANLDEQLNSFLELGKEAHDMIVSCKSFRPMVEKLKEY